MTLTCMTLWLLVVLNWYRFRDSLYPAFIQSCVWAGVTTLFVTAPDYGPVTTTTCIVIALGAITFTVVSWFATLGHSPSQGRCWPSKQPSGLRPLLIILVPIALLPFFVHTAMAIAQGGLTDSLFVSLRNQLGTEEASLGHFDLAMKLSFAAVGIAMLRFYGTRQHRRSWFCAAALTLAVALIYAILFTGRNFVLFACLVALGVPLILRAISTKRTIVALILLVLSLFAAYAVILDHANVAELSTGESVKPLWDLVTLYAAGPIAAFDILVRQPHHCEWGINSFRNIVLWLNEFGWHLELRPIVQEFVDVGNSGWQTNIYTVYQPVYLDFGIVGVVIFQIFAAAWHSHLWLKATEPRPNSGYVLLYALFLLPLAMQVEVDYYLTIVSQWLFLVSVVFFACAFPPQGAEVPAS